MAVCTRHTVKCLTGSQWHSVSYIEWTPEGGVPEARRDQVVVCVHGLTRNAHDFDYLGEYLARLEGFRVVAVDIPGRGQSEWLQDSALYIYPTYASVMVTVLAKLDAKTVYWVGTSMGGLIGMWLANCNNAPIAKLIVNDIGPYVPRSGLHRLAEYVGKEPVQPTIEALAQYLKGIYHGFGALSDAQWYSLAASSARAVDGGFRMSYDPAIARVFSVTETHDLNLFEAIWDNIKCPVYVLHGKDSDLMVPRTLEQMRSRGPGVVEAVELEGIGHAPSLLFDEQVAILCRWIKSA